MRMRPLEARMGNKTKMPMSLKIRISLFKLAERELLSLTLHTTRQNLFPRSFPEDLLPKLPSVSPTSNHSKSASQSNISVKPTTKTFARSLTQDINLDEFLKPKASASEGTLDATKRPSATQEVHVLPKKAISIEDDVCSTDSSLIEDIEVKKKKRKLFNFSKRSKKGEKSWVEFLLSYFIKLVDTLNLPALISSTYMFFVS